MAALRLLGLHGNHDHAHHNEEIWHPEVLQISALLNQGVDSFWHRVQKFKRLQQANHKFEYRRQQQAQAWMWERIDAGLKQNFRAQVSVKALLPELTQKVISGQVPASTAARQLLAAYQATGFPTN